MQSPSLCLKSWQTCWCYSIKSVSAIFFWLLFHLCYQTLILLWFMLRNYCSLMICNSLNDRKVLQEDGKWAKQVEKPKPAFCWLVSFNTRRRFAKAVTHGQLQLQLLGCWCQLSLPAPARPPELLARQLPDCHGLQSPTSLSAIPQQLSGSSCPAVHTPGAGWSAGVAGPSASQAPASWSILQQWVTQNVLWFSFSCQQDREARQRSVCQGYQ